MLLAHYAFDFLTLMSKIPKITIKVPNICKAVKLSSRKIIANTIVDIGPIPATIAKFEELIYFMDADTKNEGITVANTAMRIPKK